MCGGRIGEGFVAFYQSVSDGRWFTGLGIGFVNLGPRPLEGGHRGVGGGWAQVPPIPSIRKRRHTVWRRHKEPKTVGLSRREDRADPLTWPFMRRSAKSENTFTFVMVKGCKGGTFAAVAPY